MLLPYLDNENTKETTVSAFKGYNHNPVIPEDEFFDTCNMSNNLYPVLGVRNKKYTCIAGVADKKPQGMLRMPGDTSSEEFVYYIEGGHLYVNGTKVETISFTCDPTSSDYHKQMAYMNGYIVVMPDKKYISTLDFSDRGDIENFFTLPLSTTTETYKVKGEICVLNDKDFSAIPSSSVSSKTAPLSPKDGDYWIDTSQHVAKLKKYSSALGAWSIQANTYVKLTATYTDAAGSTHKLSDGFSVGDVVDISGVVAAHAWMQDIGGGKGVYIYGIDETAGSIVVAGIMTMGSFEQKNLSEIPAISVKRTMPKMDFVFSSGNRLWGCRYGTGNNGETVNEIYCSKWSDFKNWNVYQGLSSDAWAAGVGVPGKFTGAAFYGGYPTFFKEHHMFRVAGSSVPFSVQTNTVDGVAPGSEDSLAIIDGVLYYHGADGIFRYDGSLPVNISSDLGSVRYKNAVGGRYGKKYAVSMQNAQSGEWSLFTYDTARRIWQRVDKTHMLMCSSTGNNLYYFDAANKALVSLLKPVQFVNAVREGEFTWWAESGVITRSTPDKKYLHRLSLRLNIPPGARCAVDIEYDSSGVWEQRRELTGRVLKSFDVPIRPRRCDHFRIRIKGTGDVKLYSITKSIEGGSGRE